jgi:hypothetical protein
LKRKFDHKEEESEEVEEETRVDKVEENDDAKEEDDEEEEKEESGEFLRSINDHLTNAKKNISTITILKTKAIESKETNTAINKPKHIRFKEINTITKPKINKKIPGEKVKDQVHGSVKGITNTNSAEGNLERDGFEEIFVPKAVRHFIDLTDDTD